MDVKDFNTKEGIAARLGSYAALRELLEARRRFVTGQEFEVVPFTARTDDAGIGETTERLPIGPMPLEAFYILGLICTDQNGQVVRLNPQVFDEARRAKMPAVMTEDEFLEFTDEEGLKLGELFLLPDIGD